MIAARKSVTTGDVAAHYDDLDVFYREIWGPHVHHGLWRTGRETQEEAVENLSRHVAGLGGIEAGARVCDVGCGYGETARLLARERGAEVTGITISRRQFEECERQPDPGVSFLHGDWLANDLPAASFDAVIAIESSEHMPDKARFFAEAARVLRPGGRLVVCAWLAGDRLGTFARRHLVEAICLEGRMPEVGTEADYRALAANAVLEVTGFEDVSRQVRKTWRLCAIRFLRAFLGDPRYLRFLVNRGQPNRIFALTLFRLLIAFRTGAMRYGILTARRPRDRTSA